MSRKTTPRETEKPKKLTRAQKKEIDAVLRKYKGDGKPRTAQATIPYEAIYPDGVCRIDRRTFSKCIAFEDISYQLAQPETRTAIFEHLCDLYNYVDTQRQALKHRSRTAFPSTSCAMRIPPVIIVLSLTTACRLPV